MTDDLFSVAEATARRDAGIDSAEDHMDPEWHRLMLWTIRSIVPGTEFLIEDVVARVATRGIETHDRRAAGAIAREASRLGLIESAGYAAANTSNRSPKTLWIRTEPKARTDA